MVEIIVKKDFSEQDVKQAKLAAAAYRKPQPTSQVSNVLDMADTKKTVVLCADHVRKFATPQVLSQYGYRWMRDYPYVMGNCDYCGLHTKCQVFSHESVYADVWKSKAERRRDHATSIVVRG